MGSPLPVDESKNGWLATLGCCAPRTYNQDEDEEQFRGREKERSLEGECNLVFDQPPLTARPRLEPELPRPLTSYSMGQAISSWVESGRDIAARASSRASTIRSRSRAWTGQSRKSRPSFTIGAPTDFRRLDESDATPVPRRRTSFRPLELSIYLPDNRLSPLPDFYSEWDQVLAGLECPAPAVLRSRPSSIATTPSNFLVQRKPIRSSIDGSISSTNHSRSSSRLSIDPPSTNVTRPPSVLPWMDPLAANPPTPPAHITQHPALIRSNTQTSLPAVPRPTSRVNAPSPALSTRSRAMTEPTRGRSTPSPTPPAIPVKRGSMRRANNPVEDAIRELNTIVEERRAADASRATGNPLSPNGVPLSPSHHVPAIAPSLRMHVRSETLSDIGSAFSVPLSSKPLPSTPFSPMAMGEKRPLTSKALGATVSIDEVKSTFEDDEPSRPSTSASMMALSATKTRLSLWFRRQTRARKYSWDMPPPESTEQGAQPFYQCTDAPMPRTHGHQESISSVSTYATTPSLSGRTERTSISIVSPISPETPTSKRSRSLQSATLNGADFAKEIMPPVTQIIDSQTVSPMSPTKVGLAF